MKERRGASVDQAPPSSPAQGAAGAQQGLEPPGRGQEPPASAWLEVSLQQTAGSHACPPAPHLGVSASEPRSNALCTSPVRLAICFSIASIRSLPWGRARGWVRTLRIFLDSPTPTRQVLASPTSNVREVAVLLSPATPTPFFPLCSCLQLLLVAPLSPAQFGALSPVLTPLPRWQWGKAFLCSSPTSPAAPTDDHHSSKAHGVSPMLLLTSFPYPWLVQESQTLRAGDRRGQGTAPEGRRSWGCAAC